MEKVYKAYMKIQKLKWQFKFMQSKARRNNDKETADEYGDRAAVVDRCMEILAEEFNLKFEL